MISDCDDSRRIVILLVISSNVSSQSGFGDSMVKLIELDCECYAIFFVIVFFMGFSL